MSNNLPNKKVLIIWAILAVLLILFLVNQNSKNDLQKLIISKYNAAKEKYYALNMKDFQQRETIMYEDSREEKTVYSTENSIFSIERCGGKGGICRGSFYENNILTKSRKTIIENTVDFFMSNDGKKLIIFTTEDWIAYKIWVYNFETRQLIDQSITLKCLNVTNMPPGRLCKDLFLDNNNNDGIIYVPLDYEGTTVGDAYKLVTNNSTEKPVKFNIRVNVLNKLNIIYNI